MLLSIVRSKKKLNHYAHIFVSSVLYYCVPVFVSNDTSIKVEVGHWFYCKYLGRGLNICWIYLTVGRLLRRRVWELQWDRIEIDRRFAGILEANRVEFSRSISHNIRVCIFASHICGNADRCMLLASGNEANSFGPRCLPWFYFVLVSLDGWRAASRGRALQLGYRSCKRIWV
jgi:hypothetical protein